MRFAYADPPYLGNGQMYREHPRWRDADQRWWHDRLLAWLLECWPDGWALSTNARDLRWLLPDLPPEVRVCPWVKPVTPILGDRNALGVPTTWEPLLLYGGRLSYRPRFDGRQQHDWLMANAAGMKKAGDRRPGRSPAIPRGKKPVAFVIWMLNLLGFDPDMDHIDDLFPGSGIVGDVVAEMRGGWIAGPDRLPLAAF